MGLKDTDGRPTSSVLSLIERRLDTREISLIMIRCEASWSGGTSGKNRANVFLASARCLEVMLDIEAVEETLEDRGRRVRRVDLVGADRLELAPRLL